MKSESRAAITLMFVILVAASLASGFHLPIAGRRIRPEHIAAPAVFAAFVLFRLARRETAVRIDVFSVLAVAWVVSNAISSWLYAPQASESLVHVVRLSFLGAVFLTIANLPLLRAEQWASRLRAWLRLGLVALAYGVLVWSLARYGDVWLPGALMEPGLSGISIQGTQFERNLFGILAATIAAVAVYSLLAQRRRGPPLLASRGLLVVACVLAGSALVLSLTRSAWISAVLASPAAYLMFDRSRLSRGDRPLLQAIVGLPVLLGSLFAILRILPAPATIAAPVPPSTSAVAPATVATPATVAKPTPAQASAAAPASAVGDRLSTLGRLGSDFTLTTRIQDARWALGDWLTSPLLGHGTGSFGQIHGSRVGTEAWVSNLILHTLVDTGLLGLAIQISLFVLVAGRTWRAARVTSDPQLEVGLKAMTLGFLVMVIAYQITDGTWLAVFWIHLGLMVNGVYCVREEQRRVAEVQLDAPSSARRATDEGATRPATARVASGWRA